MSIENLEDLAWSMMEGTGLGKAHQRDVDRIAQLEAENERLRAVEKAARLVLVHYNVEETPFLKSVTIRKDTFDALRAALGRGEEDR